eukprot:1128416-Pelagomonas_calceolata.AAC.1
MSCFKSGPRSRDLLQQANSERRDLNTQNQQLARKVQQLNDALQLQRQEAGQAQEQQAKVFTAFYPSVFTHTIHLAELECLASVTGKVPYCFHQLLRQ